MNATTEGKKWKGLLASIILSGAGQFLAGARQRGIAWLVVIGLGPLLLLGLYSLPMIPAKAGPVVVVAIAIMWLAMLYDSYRPILPLRWQGWILLILLSFAFSEMISRVAHRVFQVYHVPTKAMAPTINDGDDVLIYRGAYWFREPHRGDLIVFDASRISNIPQDHSGKEVIFIKRLVGLPNDTLEIGAGTIWINNIKMQFGDPRHPIEYRYVGNEILPQGVKSYGVSAGEYFALGDNSAQSYDSRYWGTIRRDAIRGRVTKIYWPWNRMSTPQ